MPKQKTKSRRAPRPRNRKPTNRNAQNGNSANEWIEPYDSDNPKLGLPELPELLEAPPTTEIIVHATFTAQHIIGELRYHFEVGNLTRGDRMMLAQLGKEIREELDKED